MFKIGRLQIPSLKRCTLGVMIWIDLVVLLLLLTLWIYIFASVTITNLHKVYLGFHFFMMFWPFCQFAIKTTEDIRLQLFYVKLAFLDLAFLAVGWLFFTLLLTGYSLNSRRRLCFAIPVPALIVTLGVIFNPNAMFVQPLHGGFIQRTYGPFFWITAVVLVGYGIVSLYIIYQTLVSDHSPRIKKQVKQVLRGILVMVAFIWADIFINVVHPFSQSVTPGLTSLGILLSAVFFVIAIHRDKVFNLITIAHQDIINTITLGILVLDENEMIMEINQSLPSYIDLQIGEPVRHSFHFPTAGAFKQHESVLENIHGMPSGKRRYRRIITKTRSASCPYSCSRFSNHGGKLPGGTHYYFPGYERNASSH
ncbi:histidine kinase N-terminal 7TM domain-containing protein [Paenibacillus sp. D2_2]|uniref:histidine kinase N-terminal 7TM domain-containing protein n=1 Tax=Paenibacillus sp. D2_2 TaxID=3073092 RepID=UPI002815A566|nr:histidine kinase N-terminal 7TM domain-containing protein [Paenibacillus sp. D2_2]WMT43314.1 histidine kinase N-terminal 7TM domain-containing protein [Paenibacillus sp. D2_2]